MPKTPRTPKKRPESPDDDSAKKEFPYYKELRAKREREGITREVPSEQTRVTAAPARGAEKEQRDFPYRSKGGTWVHPKTGAFISDAQAKRIIRGTERRIIVKNLAQETGKSPKEIRKRLRGVKTTDIVGEHLYAKRNEKTGKVEQTRGHYKVSKRKDTRKTIKRKGKRVKNPDYGKTKRTRRIVTGPNAKGRKALRGLGIVAFGGASLLRY